MVRPTFVALAVLAMLVCRAEGRDALPGARVVTCPAPSGRAVASIARSSGGGAAGWAYNEVRVHAASAPLDSGRRVFGTADEGNVQLHAYWRGPAELVVEYPARLSRPRLEGFASLGADTVWVTPRPVRGMELNASDAPTCYPYRDGWPQTRPAPPGT
jgi:hypothetical protein